MWRRVRRSLLSYPDADSLKGAVMQASFNHQNAEMLSRAFEGSLSLMPLSDIIQWVEVSRRSGTLIVNTDEEVKRLYFNSEN